MFTLLIVCAIPVLFRTVTLLIVCLVLLRHLSCVGQVGTVLGLFLLPGGFPLPHGAGGAGGGISGSWIIWLFEFVF